MIDFKEAESIALSKIEKIDKVQEYENYFVFIDDPDIPMDSSIGMVAVRKEDGKACNFVSVIPKLGKLISEQML